MTVYKLHVHILEHNYDLKLSFTENSELYVTTVDINHGRMIDF